MRYLLITLLMLCICTLWYFNKEQERIIKRQDKLIEELRSEMKKQNSFYIDLCARKDSINNAFYNKFKELLERQNNGNQD